MVGSFTPSIWKWSGIVLVCAVGLIHLLEAPEYFEAATYLGLSFLANAAMAVVAAYGIRKNRGWGWALGILIAGGAFAMYIVSRTVGLPGLAEAEFFEPMGVASLLVEGAFVVLGAYTLSGSTRRVPPADDREPGHVHFE